VVNKVISEDYLDLIFENSVLDFEKEEGNITTINNMHSMMHVPSQRIEKCSLKDYRYQVFQSLFSLESKISLEESGVIQVRNTPDFGFLGQGVLVGIIDTGIEYQHEAFQNEDKTSRILAIWDQTINEGGEPPESFTYGTEYTQEMIDIALRSSNPLSIVPSTDKIGHGTMIAGIIAGNDNPYEDFSGVVPQAELVVVKLKQAKNVNREIFLVPPDRICYQDTDVMLGARYIVSVAEKLKRPLVLCIALGTNQGGHDGHGALSTYLTLLTQHPKMAVVIAAGNEGNTKRHFMGNMEAEQEFSEFELKVSDKDKAFSMELWTDPPSQVAIDITSPAGEYVPTIYPALAECVRHTFNFQSSILWINNIIAEGETGDQLILMRFENPQQGIWKFKVYNIYDINTQFNVWLPGGDFISDDTFFLDSSPDSTTTSPSNAEEPITITAYNPENGEIGSFASRGYTRSNFIKPDLAAPGVNITCPTLNNSYGTVSGTGAAAANTTGIVAMVLEWAVIKGHNTYIKGYDLKKLLIRGAERDMDMTYPNNIWGYGKVDIYQLYQLLR
jgi:subtilisin family serine protease